MDQTEPRVMDQAEPLAGELLSTSTGEPVSHYEMGRLDSKQTAKHVHPGTVVEWFIGSPAGSIEGHAIVRWDEDGTYHVVNVKDLLHRPEA